MHSDASDRRARAGVTAFALCMAVVGALLLLAPREMLPDAGRPVLVQLLGAALLGYASANWIARGAALGGIYGRAVVAGNQMHLMVGALLLLTQRAEIRGAPAAYWVLTVLYVLGAVFFTYLMFVSSGLRNNVGAKVQRN